MPALMGKGGQPLPSKTVQYRDFSTGLVRAGSRSGIPETGLWELINGQIIGPGQILTLPSPGASIVTFSPVATSLWGVMITLSGTMSSRIIAVRTDGSALAVNPANGATTTICTAGNLSANARVIMWRDTHVLFGDPAVGLASWDGTTFVKYPATFTASTTTGVSTITWTAGTVATALYVGEGITGTGIPAGTTILSIVGTTITMSNNATGTASVTVTVGGAAPASVLDLAVFEARVWLQTAPRGFTFSGPSSFTNFETTYAGGAAVMPDAIFEGSITRMVAAMQLLWITGPDAVNTISNVQVVSGFTTFQNENIVAGAGTPYGDSVQPLLRTLVFLTPPGVYAILGATPQKLSDALDGLFPTVTGFGTHSPAAVFTLNNILVYLVLVQINGVTKQLVYSRPTWLVADQGTDLIWVTTVVRTSGAIECWGTNGSNLVQLFAGTMGTYSVRSRFEDFGAFTQRKSVFRVAVEADVTGTGTPDIHLELENEQGQTEVVGNVTLQAVTWINNVGNPVTWVNNVAAPVTWVAAGHIVLKGEARFSGNLLGFHLYGTSAPLTIGAYAEEVGALGEWTFAAG